MIWMRCRSIRLVGWGERMNCLAITWIQCWKNSIILWLREVSGMSTITAIYENGVFRPTEPVDLPEGCKVRIVPELESTPETEAHLDRVYGILSRRYKSGHHDTAERHDEHQP